MVDFFSVCSMVGSKFILISLKGYSITDRSAKSRIVKLQYVEEFQTISQQQFAIGCVAPDALHTLE